MNEPTLWIGLLIGLTCVVSWLGFRSRAVEEKYIFHPQAILAWKEYYRLVTSGFLHANWSHLFLNMLTLYLFGVAIVSFVGPAHFFLIYFAGIVGGNLLSLYVHRHHEYRAYGASGGACGLVFASILLFPGATISSFLLPVPVPGWLYAVVFMIGSFLAMKANNKGDIGHDDHLGGAIIGLLTAAALHPRQANRNWKILLIVAGAAVLLLIYLWFNPLFLPINSFLRRAWRKRPVLPSAPAHRREALEIDAILEKIARSGMESLSAEEKRFLQSVSGKYQRRSESKKPGSGLPI